MSQYERQEQAFNMAMASLKRLNDEMIKANFYSSMGVIGFNDWMNTLNNIYREMKPDIEKLEDEAKKRLHSLRDKMMNTSIQYNTYREKTQTQDISFMLQKSIKEFFNALDEFNCELNVLIDSKGYRMPSLSDPRFAVLRR